MKVYVITKGEYSDYRIIGVTENKNKAIEIAKLYNHELEPADIEEYDTDDLCDLDSSTCHWRVRICKNNHAVSSVTKLENYPNDVRIYEELNDYALYINAKDEEHAIKVACDQLAKWLAEIEGL